MALRDGHVCKMLKTKNAHRDLVRKTLKFTRFDENEEVGS